MRLEIITGTPGCGKTKHIVNRAIRERGLYLMAFPICDLIAEQSQEVRNHSYNIYVDTITSKNSKATTSLDLIRKKKEIENAGLPHAILLTTHETIKLCGLDQFSGWDVCVDEAIATSESGYVSISLCQDWLDARAEITPSPIKGWSYLHIPTNKYKESDLRQVPSLSEMSKMIRAASIRNRVLIDASSFKRSNNIKWCSIWQLSQESQLKSLTLSYSSGGRNIAFEAEMALNKSSAPAITVMPNRRTGQPKIRIGYFTDSHEGTTVYWQKYDGKFVLNEICNFLSSKSNNDIYWSGNECVTGYMVHRIPGFMISSQCAGLNAYRNYRSCAFFYSAKATREDDVLLDIINSDKSLICEAREHEAIFQFVFRGAIRDPAYSGPYQIYVYSKSQAEELNRRLNHAGFTDVNLRAIHEAGVMSVKRAEPSTPKGVSRPKSPEKAAADRDKRNEKSRAKAASKAVAAGREPGKPGRPRKNADLNQQQAPRKRGRPRKNE